MKTELNKYTIPDGWPTDGLFFLDYNCPYEYRALKRKFTEQQYYEHILKTCKNNYGREKNYYRYLHKNTYRDVLEEDRIRSHKEMISRRDVVRLIKLKIEECRKKK
jgi:hypothetical protein